MTLTFPSQVRITEVGPRDGLQNEAEVMPTGAKIALIKRLAAAGTREIELTSFTHPRWIPNLADAEDVVRGTADLDLTAWALVPNRRGLDRALATGVGGVTLVMSVTDGHNKANLNRTSDGSLAELIDLMAEAMAADTRVRISLSVVFGCPFEGQVDPARTIQIVDRFVEAGAARIGLCDTIGVATPDQVHGLSSALRARHPQTDFELHLHDTRGLALANTLAGLHAGIAAFDSSVGGLGGCPYAPGASGNSATEDLNAMLTGMGINTGLDQARLLEAARQLADWRTRPLDSASWRVATAQTRGKENT